MLASQPIRELPRDMISGSDGLDEECEQTKKGPCKQFVRQFAWPFLGFSLITTAYRSYSHPWKCRLIVMTANRLLEDSRCMMHDAQLG